MGGKTRRTDLVRGERLLSLLRASRVSKRRCAFGPWLLCVWCRGKRFGLGMRLMLMRQDRRPALPGQVYESEKDKWLWAEWELPHLRDGKRARGSARMDGQEG